MKNRLTAVILFAAAFTGVYLAMCYLVPGLRIKLAAEPMVYFIESIKHGFAFKAAVSAAAGAAAAAATPAIIKKTVRRRKNR